MVHPVLTSRRPRADAGFTLAELIIVIVVVAIAGITFASMFSEAVRTYEFVDADKTMLQEARYAEERIARELRRVRDGTSILIAEPTTLTFVDRDDRTIGFSWSGVPGADLLFTTDGVSRKLASGVDSLAFSYWRSDGAAAAPAVAPQETDIRRVTVYMRLVKGSQKIGIVGAAFLRLP